MSEAASEPQLAVKKSSKEITFVSEGNKQQPTLH